MIKYMLFPQWYVLLSTGFNSTALASRRLQRRSTGSKPKRLVAVSIATWHRYTAPRKTSLFVIKLLPLVIESGLGSITWKPKRCMNGSMALTCHSRIGRLRSQTMLMVLKTALNCISMSHQILTTTSGMMKIVTIITWVMFVNGALELLKLLLSY